MLRSAVRRGIACAPATRKQVAWGGARWLSDDRKKDDLENNKEEPLVEVSDMVPEGAALIGGMPVNPFKMNQYVLGCHKTNKGAIIDCGAASEEEFEAFRELFTTEGMELEMILLTHGHVDHVLGLGLARKYFPEVEIFMHMKDWQVYEKAADAAESYGMKLPHPLPQKNIKDLSGIPSFSIGSLNLKVIESPGHSPGHVCFLEEGTGTLFGGDLLFKGSVGRTDFPLSSPSDMQRSLRNILKLDDEVQVYPGHGEATTIGEERANNPFLTQLLSN